MPGYLRTAVLKYNLRSVFTVICFYANTCCLKSDVNMTSVTTQLRMSGPVYYKHGMCSAHGQQKFVNWRSRRISPPR